jgi:hypothetical protein
MMLAAGERLARPPIVEDLVVVPLRDRGDLGTGRRPTRERRMSKGVLAEGEELGSNILHPEMLCAGCLGRPARHLESNLRPSGYERAQSDCRR